MKILGVSPIFKASSIDQLEGAVEACLGGSIARAPTDARDFSAQGHRRQLTKTVLWHCSYQIPISLKLPDSGSIRLQIPIVRSGLTRTRGKSVPISGGAVCVSTGSIEVDFEAGYRQFVWLPDRTALEDKLRAMTGSDSVKPLVFAPELDLNSTMWGGLKDVLSCLIRQLERPSSGLTTDLVADELEQAVMVAFLASTQRNYLQNFNQRMPNVAPRQVRRAESYMEAHWQHLITIDDLARISGASARSLFRTFQKYRGYTPLDFLRGVRLNQARRMLEVGEGVSVTEVALTCGFGDISSFSRAFSAKFGMPPSAVLRNNTP